jgi:hypothetical protein
MSKYSVAKQLETEIKASGTEIFEDKTWRNLNIISFYNNFLDMFLENHITPKNQNKAKMIIYMYLDQILENIKTYLITKSTELKQLTKVTPLTQADMTEINNKSTYIEDIAYKVQSINDTKSKMTSQSSINDFNFEGDELSRIYDFVTILKKILYDEQLFMSILKYYFQYLIKFDYAIYQLPSCRKLEDPGYKYTKPERTTTSPHPTKEAYEQGLQKMGKKPQKGGTKKRKFSINRKIKRKTKKIRKIKRLKKYKLN